MITLSKPVIIALDGYSSCGKSSFAKLIARETNYIYIDSGAMYRAITHYALEHGLVKGNTVEEEKLIAALPDLQISFDYSEGKLNTCLNKKNIEPEIRDIHVSDSVSIVSKISKVRKRLVQLQQDLGKNKGVVMDGRDIGTVVFPDAELKLFMTAGVEVRAKRRYEELIGLGKKVSFKEVKKNIEDRDYNDLNRAVSPLRKASDAVELDNSTMSFEEQMQWFIKLLKSRGLI